MLANFFVAAATLATFVTAQIDLSSPDSGAAGQYLDPNEQVPFQFDIDYTVIDKPDSGVLEIFNGEEIQLNYTFTNNEVEEVHIVGVGGSFSNPTSGEVLANITDAKVGPVTLQPGESGAFIQRIGVNVPVNNYLLTPGLYVVRGSSLAMLGAKTVLAIVDEKPISLFAPELIILELLLIITLGIAGYFVYINYGASYFKTVTKTSTAPTAKPVKAKATAAKVDESWLPEHHIKKNKKKTA